MSDPTKKSRGETTLLQLAELHIPWLEGFIRGRLTGELRRFAETADILQDVFLQLLRHQSRIAVENESQLRALLARIVLNRLADKKRWVLRKKRDPRHETITPTPANFHAHHPVEKRGPIHFAQKKEVRQKLRAAMEHLRPSDRQVLLLRDLENRSFTEIGNATSMTRQGARIRYERALFKLAAELQKPQ